MLRFLLALGLVVAAAGGWWLWRTPPAPDAPPRLVASPPPPVWDNAYPLARPTQAQWRVLDDATRYQQVFVLQQQGEWEMANRMFTEIKDKSLRGHVLYRRYIHPAYSASWAELSDWINRYVELPMAWDIYLLAQNKKPASAQLPPAPPERVYAFVPTINTIFAPDTPQREIYDKAIALCRQAYPTGAWAYVNSAQTRPQLGDKQFTYLRLRIAYSFLVLGHTEKSRQLALPAVAERNEFPMVDWYLGFAAWREKNVPLAATHFVALADNLYANTRERAKGAYWAARALRQTQQEKTADYYLAQASRFGVNFYSLLAQWQRNQRVVVEWRPPVLPDNDTAQLAQYASVARAVLLSRAAQYDLAELELLRLMERIAQEDLPALQWLAKHYGIPAIEIATAARLLVLAQQHDDFAPRLMTSLYPFIPYLGAEDFLLDRALVFALIRQESKFRLTAKSSAGARGMMQLMPTTAAYVSGDDALKEPYQQMRLHTAQLNLLIGQQYLTQLMSPRYKVGDNLMTVLGSYNAGPGNIKRWRSKRKHLTDPLTFLESLPADETRLYITRVLENMWLYRHRLGQPMPSLAELAQNQWPHYHGLDRARIH